MNSEVGGEIFAICQSEAETSKRFATSYIAEIRNAGGAAQLLAERESAG